MAEPLLQIEALTKRFGGVIASDAISLDVPRGELHAVIGPNGAGKTTLIGQLTGELAPNAGHIRFDGADITDLPVYRRSQLGRNLAGQLADQRGLAGAVRADNGVQRALWHRQRDLVGGDDAAEALGEALDLEQGTRHGANSRAYRRCRHARTARSRAASGPV